MSLTDKLFVALQIVVIVTVFVFFYWYAGHFLNWPIIGQIVTGGFSVVVTAVVFYLSMIFGGFLTAVTFSDEEARTPAKMGFAIVFCFLLMATSILYWTGVMKNLLSTVG